MLLTPFDGSPPLPYFEVSFDVLTVGATARLPGGAGLSFNYGRIARGGALDVSGSGHDGLSVSLRTGNAHVIEVRLGGLLELPRSLTLVIFHDVL